MKNFTVAKPQWISLLILLSSWLLVQLFAFSCFWAFSYQMPALFLVVAQSLIAVGMTWLLALPVWWLLINVSFPLAVFYGDALQWPPALFLAAFLILVLIYWSIFFTRVPYYPSHHAVRDLVSQLLPTDSDQRFLDLGSGLGGMCLHIAKHRPDYQVVGIEIAPLPWLFSWLAAKFKALPCEFIRGNYQKHNLRDYSLVFAYLSPAAMSALWRQACEQMQPGSVLVSYEFAVPEQPIEPIYLSDQTPVYVWQMGLINNEED